MKKQHIRAVCLLTALVSVGLGTAWAAGLLIESATDNVKFPGQTVAFNEMLVVTSPCPQAGACSVQKVTSPKRGGTYAFRHRIPVGSGTRAEIDDASFHRYPKEGYNYWYGFSLFVPTTAGMYPKDSTTQYVAFQYVAQWRLSNVKEFGSTVPNCSFGGGGSGHRLLIQNNRWVFKFVRQDPAEPACDGGIVSEIDLGSVVKGVWTDFVLQGLWSGGDNGKLRIWTKTQNGSWSERARNGSNWFARYRAGSGRSGDLVAAPNFTVGLYDRNEQDRDVSRDLFSDQIKVVQVPTSQEDWPSSFRQVSPDGSAPSTTSSASFSTSNLSVNSN